MPMPKLTIKEIARIAGVSPSAVSIVLNNRPGVSERTRQKVSEIVEKLQYIPNQNSRRLLFNKTFNIAVLFKKNISPLEHFFTAELNQVILNECESLGYNLVFSSVTVENGQVGLPNIVRSYDVDGIILYGDVEAGIINSLIPFDIPTVIVDSHQTMAHTLHVCADYQQAAYTATRYLIECGHKDIAYIGTSTQSSFNTQTFTGYKKAIEEHRLPVALHWMQFDAFDETSAYAAMSNILDGGSQPTAVCCSADIYAIGALRCIKDRGLHVPEDISLIGIDDILLAAYVDPPLTTVKIDKVQMGQLAMRLLIERIENPEKNPENALAASGQLVVRGSTRTLSQH